MIRARTTGDQNWSWIKAAAARAVATLAWRLSASTSTRGIPTPAELARLPFDEVWERLIQQVQAHRVVQVDLLVCRDGEKLCEQNWNDPANADLIQCAWSVSVTFPNRDGRRCELRASGPGAAAPEPADLARLTEILKTFGIRFAIDSEPLVRLATIRDAAEEESSRWSCTQRAA